MLSGLKTTFTTASSAGLLPAFGWALLLVAAFAASAAGWAVHRWDKGAQAIAENVTLKAQRSADAKAYHELLTEAKAGQQRNVDQAAEMRAASERMGAIATLLEKNLESNHAFAARQQDELVALLARRPDLRTQHLGGDVLQHWNKSNQGAAGSSAAPAKPPGKPAHAMPGAASSTQRPGAGSTGESRRGDRAVSGLSIPQRVAGVSRRRVASHRLVLVLQRGGSTRPRCVGVPCA